MGFHVCSGLPSCDYGVVDGQSRPRLSFPIRSRMLSLPRFRLRVSFMAGVPFGFQSCLLSEWDRHSDATSGNPHERNPSARVEPECLLDWSTVQRSGQGDGGAPCDSATKHGNSAKCCEGLEILGFCASGRFSMRDFGQTKAEMEESGRPQRMADA